MTPLLDLFFLKKHWPASLTEAALLSKEQHYMTPPTATSLQALSIDEMLAYFAPPPPIAPTVQPSTDPSVYQSDPGYQKGLNKQWMEQFLVAVPNRHAFDKYRFELQNWAGPNGNYRSGALPAPPQYVSLDDAKFDEWWSHYCESYGNGENPPPIDFIVPVRPLPPAPVIAAPAPPTSGSPVGQANGANIYMSSPGDSSARFQDGAIYQDSGGTYIKHVYITPFGTTVFWNKVA